VNKNFIRIGIGVIGIIIIAVLLRWAITISLNRPRPQKLQEATLTPQAIQPVKEPAVIKEASQLLSRGQRADAVKVLEKEISSKKSSSKAYDALLMLADIYKEDANLLKAKELYLAAINEYPDYCNYTEVQNRLSSLNIDILFSPIITPESETYTVAAGDSITKISKRYSTTPELIRRANGLKLDLIRPGRKLKVQKIPFSIIVDKSQSTLTLLQGDSVVKIYTVSTGKNNSTPTGTFKIKDKLVDPVWYSPKGAIPPNTPENILGSRWMGLNTTEPGYGIHGTTDPKSIGYQCTEGCVRMTNTDVEELFTIVPEGTSVTIID
jgi:lipoprotein-anchoring transpeptidase ErfK/SrfK